jgi:nucleoside-diphosphate-sugar epimerase
MTGLRITVFGQSKDVIDSEEQLEERLSRPTAADIDAMRALEGDVIVLGAGGKMGPSLVRLMRRAAAESGVTRKIIAVARFSGQHLKASLEAEGIETICSDLLQEGALRSLPEVRNVIYMAARMFGTTGCEHLSWAINTQLPALVADYYRHSRILCFSSGNVYPLRPLHLGGATEETPVAPPGEYALSVLGRERIFEHVSHPVGNSGGFSEAQLRYRSSL